MNLRAQTKMDIPTPRNSITVILVTPTPEESIVSAMPTLAHGVKAT